MSLRGFMKAVIPIAVAIIGWFAAPIIKAKMEGTPLKGLPGIVDYWKHVFTAPLPAWMGVTAVILAISATLILLQQKKKSKPNLTVVVLPMPEPRWSIGAQRTTPFMSLHFNARFATTEEHSLEIVNGYLHGTQSVAFFSHIIVAGRYDPVAQVHLAVRPILAEPGQRVTGRVVLIDQYGNKYRTEKVIFSDLPHPPEHFGVGRTAVNCLVCGKAISAEDLHPSASFAVHRQCAK